MREIKFRAYDRDNKKWIERYYISGESGDVFDVVFGGWRHLGEGIELMQYTGLKDKNGKEIYEADVVKRIGDFGTIQYPDRRELIDVVEFKGGCFCPVCEEPSENFEIIGNVYINS